MPSASLPSSHHSLPIRAIIRGGKYRTGTKARKAARAHTSRYARRSPTFGSRFLTNRQAAVDGTVTISLTFPAAGNWQITAHGQSSNKDFVTRYTVS